MRAEKDFDGWNEVKKKTHAEKACFYAVREIWWCRLGANIGTEQDGKGDNFLRLVLILRSFGPNGCVIVPLTSSERDHPLRVVVGTIGNTLARANISQLRTIDPRRLVERVEVLDEIVFRRIRKAVRRLF